MLAGGAVFVQRTAEIYVREPNAKPFLEFNANYNSLASDRGGLLPHIFRSCAASTLFSRSFPPLDLVNCLLFALSCIELRGLTLVLNLQGTFQP